MIGKLITIEGIDGSGKSTINRKLQQHFGEDPDIVFTREPTDQWIGQAVHRAISSQTDPLAELFLFIADHADHLNRTVKPAMKAGKIVISDRYSDSRYAYQGVTLKGIIPSPLEWVRGLHKDWTVVPDRTILLDVSPEVAVTRVGNRGHQTKFEKISFLEQVRVNYMELVELEPQRFIVVDAEQPLSAVEENVLAAIEKQMET